MSKAALLELADRVEKASGPDRELDAELHYEFAVIKSKRWTRKTWVNAATKNYWNVPPYTSSLDAAMTLLGNSPIEDMSWWPSVPKGYESEQCCRVTIRDLDAGGFAGRQQFKARAATPALALTAACLRARAEMEPSDAR